MRIRPALIVLMMCMLFFSAVFAQNNYNFSKINIENGLSHNQVNAILKDGDGFLWFGTMAGLNRYDGYSFKVFRRQTNDSFSLYNNAIYSLYELPDDKMWVSTGTLPCIYDSYTEKFDPAYPAYLNSLSLPGNPVINIVKGNNGKYWFLYDSLGLYLYSSNDKKGRLFKQNYQSKSSEKITAIAETKDEKLWMVHQDGLLQQYDIKSNKLIFSSNAFQKLNKGNVSYNLLLDS